MAGDTSQTVIRSDIHFAAKDQALRGDVRQLGQLVGDLVREQGGEALFDLVEAARRASIAHREGDREAIGELESLLETLSPRMATEFIRAFSTYFQMVNMAEKVHRIRRRREYLQSSATPQPFGFIETLNRLQKAGIGRERIEALLGQISIEPVFTLHQTEVTRRTLLRKEQSIARHLVTMLDPYMTTQELNATLGQIRLEMTTGWQTDEQAAERQLGDETEHVLFFLTDVLYRMIPPYYEGLEEALAASFGESARRTRIPILVRFGTWVGGDMDSNPNVTAKEIRGSLHRHRALILDLYHKECRELERHLSQCEGRVQVAADIKTRIELYGAHFPKALHSVSARHRNMPYRAFLRLIEARLQATYDDTAFPYESPTELAADITLIADSLRANRGQSAGLFAVTRLERRVQTFGFHMTTLDIRQRADVHRRVVGEGLGEPEWAEDSEVAAARLREALDRRESPLGTLSSEGRRTLAIFQTIAHSRRKYGPQAIGPYIVSMAQGPEDVLAVLLLARWGHLGPKGSDVPLDIAPLFETPGDLENLGEIMNRLLTDERYRSHLRARDEQQIVMVGYGEGHHNVGVVSAYWSMHKAQRVLLETCQAHGVQLTLFHGRGGTISRGGRRMHDAIMAVPRAPGSGRLRLTEQGERINAKYGLRGIAMRTLELTTSALLYNLAMPTPAASVSDWDGIMETLAAESQRLYRSLTEESGMFERYFRAATPIDAIERLGISKGDSPEAGDRVSSTHWESAWTQNRCLLPAWYGFAAGVSAAIAAHGEASVRQMFNQSHFARVLLADIELTLAKADLKVASRYSELAGALHEKMFAEIKREYDASIAAVLMLSGQSKLLENADALRRAIRLRNPYVDPMSYLQVDLLRRWRSSNRRDEALLRALQATINGIAHGMQNTN